MKTENPENRTLKQQFEQVVIPQVKQMIENESNHLEWLKKQMSTNNLAKHYALKSEIVLLHLKERLKEYTEFAEKIE